MRKFAAISLLALVLLAGCEEDEEVVYTKTLQSPTAMALFCGTDGTVSGCTDQSRAYGLVYSSITGMVNLVDLHDMKILDLLPHVPGRTGIHAGYGLVALLASDATGYAVMEHGVRTFPLQAMLDAAMADASQVPVRTVPLDSPAMGAAVLGNGSVAVAVQGCPFLVVVHDGTAQALDVPQLDSTQLCSAVEDATFLALASDGTRLVVGVGAGEASSLLVIDEPAECPSCTATWIPAQRSHGWRKVAISPETPAGTFVYAIDEDGEVHVFSLEQRVECRVHPARSAVDALTRDSAERWCIPVGEATAAPTAYTEGLVPWYYGRFLDVAFFAVSPEERPDLSEPGSYDGVYAALLSSDGRIYVVRVYEEFTEDEWSALYGPDPDGSVWPSLVVSHWFKNGADLRPKDRGGDGRPQVEDPVSYFREGEAIVPDASDPQLVEWDSGSLIRVDDDFVLYSEEWTLESWGRVPGTARAFGTMTSDGSAFVWEDDGGAYCSRGVRDGMVLVVSGCDSDDDCGAGERCVRSPMQNQAFGGLCFPEDEADEMRRKCTALMVSDREFAISARTDTTLSLEELMALDPSTGSVRSCSHDADCADLGHEQSAVCSGGVCVHARLDDVTVECLSEAFQTYEVRTYGAMWAYATTSSYVPESVADASGMCVETGYPYSRYVPAHQGDSVVSLGPFSVRLSVPGEMPRRYRIRFRIRPGFYPVNVDTKASMASALVIGPDGYAYVLDGGQDVSYHSYLGRLLKVDPTQQDTSVRYVY